MKEPSIGETRSDRQADYSVGDLTIKVGSVQVLRDGVELALPRLSYDLLLALVRAAPNVVTTDELMGSVWAGVVVSPETVSQRIKLLRAALDDEARQPRYIAGVRGRGYRIVAPVSVIDSTRSPSPIPHADVTAAPASGPGHRDSGAKALSSRRLTYMIAGGGALAAAVAAYLYMRVDVTAFPATSLPLGAVSQITKLTASPGIEISPRFAPDGVRIAYAGGVSPEATDIFVTQIGGTEPLRLTQGGLNREPVWSPDGTQIAFLRQHDLNHLDLMIVPALGGPTRVLRPVQTQTYSRESGSELAWTPDGQELLFTMQRETNEGIHELSAYTLRSGNSRALGISEPPPGGRDTAPALSPDGMRLAFIRFRPGIRFGRLFVQELGPGLVPVGKPFEIPGQEQLIVRSPAWSSDGRLLRFAMGARIHEWDGHAVRLVHALAAVPQAMSIHEGKQLRAVVSVTDVDVDIHALPLDPRTHVATGPPAVRMKSTSHENFPSLSPDGRRLAFASGRSGRMALWVAEAGGANPRQLTFLDTFLLGFVGWSADGTRIAFHTVDADGAQAVYVIDADGGTPRRLGAACCPSGWTADGNHLYVAVRESSYNVGRMSVADGKREMLFEGDLAVESTDGKQLLYSKTFVPGIFARSLEGAPARNPETRLVEDYFPPFGTTVPVASGFYYVGHTPDGKPRAFRYYDYALKTAKDIAPAPSTVGIGMTLSPDESELLYAADAGGAGSDLVLLEFEGAP